MFQYQELIKHNSREVDELNRRLDICGGAN
jgi:hypothetical protein